eukprot:197585-Alexandrium_andersonii.AAC.1
MAAMPWPRPHSHPEEVTAPCRHGWPHADRVRVCEMRYARPHGVQTSSFRGEPWRWEWCWGQIGRRPA